MLRQPILSLNIERGVYILLASEYRCSMDSAFETYLLWSETCEDKVTNQMQFSEDRQAGASNDMPLLHVQLVRP